MQDLPELHLRVWYAILSSCFRGSGFHGVAGDEPGDVYNTTDLSWLDLDATVLFLDIGGGATEHPAVQGPLPAARLPCPGVDYKPVMKALAICVAHMPALRHPAEHST